MSYLALYRKYRPTTFEEVAGQTKVVKILKNSIANSRLSHAYLFYGPRGTGKTSIAKLIAKLINCANPIDGNPCDKCPSCLACLEKNNPDIIEMDAASNNGVEEIRKVIDTVGLMPNISKYKVYIIDEVHMLSTGAFNALLKTIEEPPAHVIFILATTEYYKVPETIISRCQCFSFERLAIDDIYSRLKYIVDQEKIKASDEVLKLIAKYADGGLRDAIGTLDKLCAYSNELTVQDFYELRGIVDEAFFQEFVTKLNQFDKDSILKTIDELFKNGKNTIIFVNDLLNYFTSELINNSNNLDYYDIIDSLIDLLEHMKRSSNTRILLEVGFLKIASHLKKDLKDSTISQEIVPSKNSFNNSKKESIIQELPNKVSKADENSKTIRQEEKGLKAQAQSNNKYFKVREQRINNAFAQANKELLLNLKNKWSEIANYLYNKEFATVASYLIDSNLRVAGEHDLIISVPYDALLTNMIDNCGQLEWLFKLISGNLYHMAFILDSDWEKLKTEYVNNIKNGKKYKYLPEVDENDVIIEDSSKSSLDSFNLKDDTETEAVALFGDDLVEIKD